MPTKKVLVVFVLPVIFSLIFGSAVMSDILQKPDRELNMWPISFSEEPSFNDTTIEIIGLLKQYSTSEHIEIQVKIDDSSFDCGDLYITIYSTGKKDVINNFLLAAAGEFYVNKILKTTTIKIFKRIVVQ